MLAEGGAARAFLARCLITGRPIPGFESPVFSGPVVLLCRDQEELEDTADAFVALAPLFGGEQPAVARFGEDTRARLSSLELLRAGARLVVALPEALDELVSSREEFVSKTTRFFIGRRLRRQDALENLSQAGYQRVDFVESPGEFAARGAVVDFFGLEPLQAVRVLFDEDSVVSLRIFDPQTQEILNLVSEAQAVPAEKTAAQARLSDWLGSGALRLGEDMDFGARPHEFLRGKPAMAWEEMRRLACAGWQVILYSLNRGEDSRMQELLEDVLAPGQCQFLIGPLRRGFLHPGLKLAVMATSEIFERHYRPSSRWGQFGTAQRAALRWRELRQGDFVVHQDYGIARYKGLKPVESPGHGTLDCLLLEFRGSDRLYIPMTEFGRVQKYSGAEGKRPRLSSLDTRRWEEIKRQVKEGVRELAEQLLKIQAERAARPGHAFGPETPMEREFAQAFPYEETPDQAKAIADVLADMEAPRPMDRVVIGDVGFGKTEVAMRAAFKCAAGFKQAAVLVPTTILADQHYHTFCARMADYPVSVGLLTRFQTPGEQKKIVQALKDGKIDVVIATSRLLQKDVGFKDLGLIVIDEEHRFGVKDKEKLKAFRKTVDALALSATPIPRTLNQSLSGLRGLSLIESAPVGRQPIVTKVGPWDEGVVAGAISEELARGGQAYYVHNRVRSMDEIVVQLRRLLPSARFGMVHGQMKAHEIEESMWSFFNRKYDVLVASTIIESGLDIPSVNTLLVEDAHEFGLAQLYQLRGRIGRETRRAYCYLFFSEGHGDFSALSEDARKRLDALKEFGSLGAGVKLAMRDLEIRGAGELLGARQHGFINAVGVDFYSQMLNEEVARKQGREAKAQEADVQLDIKLPAFIPEAYLPDEMRRLDFYKKILRADPAQADILLGELENLSGPAPEPVRNLFALLRVRTLAQRAWASAIVQCHGRIEIFFRPDAAIEPQTMARWTQAYGGKLKFLRSQDGDGISVALGPDESPLDWLLSHFEA